MNAFHHPYFVHALLAGTAIALAAGLVGFFLVLRAQVFTGDALSHVAFTGTLAALALGYDARLGLFAASVVFAVVIGTLGGRRGRSDDVAIGGVFCWVLGLGAFFLTLYTTRGAANGTAGVNALFGSVFGLSAGQAGLAALIALGVCAAVLLLARPLLFASVDAAVAAARGVPVRVLGTAFLVLVGICAAEAAQAVGSLLLLGLLAAPAGTAQRLTARPYRALGLSAGLAVAEMWAGLALSYGVPNLPPSFAILAVATGVYAVVLVAVRGQRGAGGPGRRNSAVLKSKPKGSGRGRGSPIGTA
jgi:zinc/manganese transport system permease protein